MQNVGTNDATVTWNTDETANSVVRVAEVPADKIAAGAAVDYRQYLLDNGRQEAQQGFVTSHQLTLSQLNPNTRYVLHVASTDPSQNGETISSEVFITTAQQVDLDPPQILPGTITYSVSETQASISWVTNELATSRVDYGTTTALGMTRTDATPKTQHTVVLTNLLPGTQYSFRVASTDTRGNGPTQSAVLTLTTAAQADLTPPVISNVRITSLGTNAVAVAWNTDEPADTFIEYGTTTAYGRTFHDPVAKTSHSATLTNLSLNTQYNYKIVATDRAENQQEDVNRTVTTAAIADTEGPVPPAAITPIPGSRRVALRWNPSTSDDIASYIVYRNGAVIASGIADTAHVDLSVTNDVTYQYSVAGVDVSGNVGTATAVASAKPSATEAPGAPTPQSPTTRIIYADQIPLTVKNSTRATSRPLVKPTYTFVIASDPELQTVIATVSKVTETSTNTSTLVAGDQFTPNETYYWAARADDGIAVGPTSSVVSFTIAPVTVTLQEFTAEGDVNGAVHVNWLLGGNRAGVSSVALLRGETVANGTQVTTFGPDGTSAETIDFGVQLGTEPTYWLRVTETSGITTEFGPVTASMAIPEKWSLSPAYPNPFNPVTEMLLAVPEVGEATVVVYNILGQPVRTLWSGPITPGVHRLAWHGMDQQGRSAASGIYIVRAMSTTGVTMHQRVTLVR